MKRKAKIQFYDASGKPTEAVSVQVLAKRGPLVAHEPFDRARRGYVDVSHLGTGGRVCAVGSVDAAKAMMRELARFDWDDVVLAKQQRHMHTSDQKLTLRRLPKWWPEARVVVRRYAVLL